MKIKMSVYADANKTIEIENEVWNNMNEDEKITFVYKNYLDNFIDNNVQSDFEVIQKYTEDEFVDKVNEEYEFAKEQNFDSIVIVVETSKDEQKISEFEDGFICDSLDGVYSTIEEISYDLYDLIQVYGWEIEGFRIE